MAVQPLGTAPNTAGSSVQPLGTPVAPAQHSFGDSMAVLGNMGGGVLDFLNNNPVSKSITSLAAVPVQLAAKAMGQQDPFRGGIGTGPGAAQVTSSDQSMGKYLESEAGNALTAGSLFFPAGRVAEGAAPFIAPVLGRFAPSAARIGTQAALGGVQGLAGGMQEGKDASELPGSAKTGALWGGALASAGELFSGMLSGIASKSGETRLTEHVHEGGAAKTLTRALNETSTPTTNPIKTLAQNNLIGDLEVGNGRINIENLTNSAGTGKLDSLIQEQKDMGTQAVAQMQGGVNLAKFKDAVVAATKENPALKASGQVGKMVAEIERRFADYGESYGAEIPYIDINRVRVAMNKVWNPDTWDAEKAIGNAARDLLYNGTGAGTVLRSAMANERELLNTMEFLQKLNATAVKGGRLGKYIADAVGATVGAMVGGGVGSMMGPAGSAIGGLAGMGVGGATTEAAVRALQSNYFDPMLAGKAQGLQNFVGSPAVQGGKQLLKTGFFTEQGQN